MSREYWTIGETAKKLGVSEKTIRRRIKCGELKARMESGRWMVEWMDVGNEESSHVSSELEVLRKQLEEKDRQIAELHVLLRQAQEQWQRFLPMPSKRQWWNPRSWFS